MRERFDAGTGLVALGAVLLLVSLFVRWYAPGGDAWAVFELVDVVLALAAVACLVALVPRYAALQRAVPAIAFVALFIVTVQLLQPPPSATGDRLEAGAWLALGATALMAAGATLSAASISVTVDVRGRDRRRRTAAIDAREREEAAAAAAEAEATEPISGPDALWRSRRVAPDEPAPVDDEPTPRRRRAAAAEASGPAPHAADPPAAAGRGAEPPEPAADPDRTQALDPVDAPREDGS